MSQEQGSISAEVVLLTPAVLVFIWLVLFAVHAFLVKELVSTALRTGGEMAGVNGSPSAASNWTRANLQELLARYGLSCQPNPDVAVQPQDIDGALSYRLSVSCSAGSLGEGSGAFPTTVARGQVTVIVDPFREKQ